MRMLRIDDSSNVLAVGYDFETNRLRVRFKSGTYEYADVRPMQFIELVTAESVGSYLARRVKPAHTAKKLSTDAVEDATPDRYRAALELIASLTTSSLASMSDVEARTRLGAVVAPAQEALET